SRLAVAAGMDIESWARPSQVEAWLDSFNSKLAQLNAVFPFYDYGTCVGCDFHGIPSRPTAIQNYGNTRYNHQNSDVWTLDDTWYVSAGAPNALAIPEIYNQD